MPVFFPAFFFIYNTMKERLQQIIQLITPDAAGLIDIGTDHGFVPVHMALRGFKGNIIATDLREEPLQKAKQYALGKGVLQKIDFYLSDGLDGCNRQLFDTIVISGMGGDTICSILDRAEWLMEPGYHLILQPMTHPEVVRYWLVNNGYRIDHELLSADADHYFQVISCRFGLNSILSDAEYLIGSSFGRREDPLYQRLIAHQIRILNKKCTGISRSGRVRDSEMRFLCQIMSQLKELQIS